MTTIEEQQIDSDFQAFELAMQRVLSPDIWQAYISAEVIERIPVQNIEEAQRIIDQRLNGNHGKRPE
jgi:hypothetical protein